MRTFLNVLLLGINRTYQMVAHHSCVVPYPLMTICPYCEQIGDIEHQCANDGDDLDAKMN